MAEVTAAEQEAIGQRATEAMRSARSDISLLQAALRGRRRESVDSVFALLRLRSIQEALEDSLALIQDPHFHGPLE